MTEYINLQELNYYNDADLGYYCMYNSHLCFIGRVKLASSVQAHASGICLKELQKKLSLVGCPNSRHRNPFGLYSASEICPI